MLKPFLEMREVDVSQCCEERDGISFLPWANCLVLLYQNGATNVKYRALQGPDGSPLFCGERHENDKGREGACYFVKVELEIDGDVSVMLHPVMNGTAVVYKDTLNQLRINNAIQRALVKCAAINTGLGIKLWEKNDETSANAEQPEEILPHTPMLVKQEIERIITAKLKSGLSNVEILQKLGIGGKEYKTIIQGLENAYWLLTALQKL